MSQFTKIDSKKKIEAVQLSKRMRSTKELTQKEVALTCKMSERTLRRAVKNFNEVGEVDGKPQKSGPHAQMDFHMQTVSLQ